MQQWLSPGERWEPLSKEISVIVSPQHTFNTDTLLLAWFAAPRRKDRCADLGTGCGTIPLVWHSRFQPAHVYAVELQEDAASQAVRSVQAQGLADCITVLQRDLRELARKNNALPLGSLDVVACNPPYQEAGTGIGNRDGGRRIARHGETCTMEDVCQTAGALLQYGGRFCLCQRPQQMVGAMAAMRGAGIEPKRLRLVQQRPGKAPSLFLLEGKKGAKPGLVVEPVLLVEGEGGGFSQEMQEMYGEYKTHGKTGIPYAPGQEGQP